jgi:hypothetical protein
VEAVCNRFDYDGLEPVVQYVEFHKAQAGGASVVKTAMAFKPTFLPNEALLKGSTCIGQSDALVKHLKKKGVGAYLVAERHGPTLPPEHIAVAVPCADSILLIEPLESPGKRIIEIKLGTPTQVVIGGAVYSFTFDPKKQMIIKTNESTKKTTQILLKDIPNFAEAVTKKYMFRKHDYPIVGADKSCVDNSVIKINMDKGIITLQIGNGAAAKRLQVPFAQFDVATDSFKGIADKDRDLFLSNAFFAKFKTPKAEILREIHQLVQNQQVMKLFYQSIRAPDKPFTV